MADQWDERAREVCEYVGCPDCNAFGADVVDATIADVAEDLRKWDREAYERGKRDGAASVWRPMDSAPRDGTRVLLTVGGETHDGQWNVRRRHWNIGFMHVDEMDVSAWMPQPPPHVPEGK